MSKHIEVKMVVTFGGHSLSANGSVNLTLHGQYSELKNAIMLTQFLNNDVTIKAKVPGQKPFKLGMFRLNSIGIDHDGESVVKFKGLNSFIEMDKLNALPTKQDGDGMFVVKMEADIEEEDEHVEE